MNILLFTVIFTTVGYAFLSIEKQKNIINLIESITELVKALKPPIGSSKQSSFEQGS